ncbi:acyltransferase [Vibrio sp. 10N.222.52.B7]|uniref:acyltransferase n=1 Tax=Vibrio sp. 10N.222.52.B7 TaxID=3229629 RepID=UPI003551D819
MAYLSRDEIKKIGFLEVGNNVKISDKAIFYEPKKITIASNSRIDDLCIISGRVSIGTYCHITPMCLIAGGVPGVVIGDFCTLAYGVKVFSQSDDYSGETMVNSLVSKEFKNEYFKEVIVEDDVIIGTNSIVMPGVTLQVGTSIGANSLVNKNTRPWSVNFGSPSKYIRERSRKLIELKSKFLNEN